MTSATEPAAPLPESDEHPEAGPVAKSGPRRWVTVAPALLALAALGVWRLDRYSLWVDEVFTLASTHDLGLTLRTTKSTMALYYIGLWLWARFGTETWWLRSFSLLGAVVAVVVVAAIARRLQPQRTTWIAPLLLVAVPIFTWTATEARAYAWETALVAGCWWFLLRGVGAVERNEPNQARWWVALIFCCAIGPLVHGLFILQVPGFAAVALVRPEAFRTLARRIAPAVVAALLPTWLIYRAGGSEMGAIWAFDLDGRLRVLRTWLLSPVAWVAAIVGIALIAGIVSAVAQARGTESVLGRTRALAPLFWAISGPVSALMVARVAIPFAPYYVAPSAAGVALLAAQGIASVCAPRCRPSHIVTVVGAFVATLLLVGVGFAAVQKPIAHQENWRGAARVIGASARSGDAIVLAGDPGSAFGTGSTLLGFTAAWREVPHSVDPTVISHTRQLDEAVVRRTPYEGTSRIQRTWRGYDRVWLVDYQNLARSSGLLDDPNIRNSYCMRRSTDFTTIRVRLFVRLQPGHDCPTR